MNAQLSHLPNGLRVATREMPHATTISIGIWVNAGARDETAQEQGIAHMLEHMAFKGTKRRDAQAIATEVENVGGFMNCLLYTSPSPRDATLSRMPSSA